MNAILEQALDRVRHLPEAEQTRLAVVIDEFTQQSAEHDQLIRDLENPDYRAYVEKALAQGEAELEAGQFAPIGEAVEPLKAKFKAAHGL